MKTTTQKNCNTQKLFILNEVSKTVDINSFDSIYINDNEQTIQSGIDTSSQADVIYISSGSFGEPQLQINNKYNIWFYLEI